MDLRREIRLLHLLGVFALVVGGGLNALRHRILNSTTTMRNR